MRLRLLRAGLFDGHDRGESLAVGPNVEVPAGVSQVSELRRPSRSSVSTRSLR